MVNDVEDKTEKPTDRRRRLAHEQGLGPRSADLTRACRMIGVAMALQWFGSRLVRDLAHLVSDGFRAPSERLTTEIFTSRAWDAASQTGVALAGVVACMLLAGLAAHWFQVGIRIQAADLLPDLSRLSLARGFSKLWQFENAQQAAICLVKYATLLTVGAAYIWLNLGRLMLLTESDVGTIGEALGRDIVTLAWYLAGVALLFGLADYGFQFWKFEQSLKMSPEEVREEARQQSGDPRWHQQRRQLWEQLAR